MVAAITTRPIIGWPMITSSSPITTPMRPYLKRGAMPDSLRGNLVPLLYQLSSLVPSSPAAAPPPGPLPAITRRSRFVRSGPMVDDDSHDDFAAGAGRG